MDVRGIVVGIVIGGVLIAGVSASGLGSAEPGSATPTWPPGYWVDTPMQAKHDTFLAEHGHCRKGYEVRQVRHTDFPVVDEGWQSTHYRCRPRR